MTTVKLLTSTVEEAERDNKPVQYPELELTTKYGTLKLTFLDPTMLSERDSRGYKFEEWKRHIMRVEGRLTINRVEIRVSAPLAWRTRRHEKGVELPEPVRYIGEDYEGSYHRRIDPEYDSAGIELPSSAARATLAALWDGDVRKLYESRTDLQRQAKLARLWDDIKRAESERDEKHTVYQKAERVLMAARRALSDHIEAELERIRAELAK